MMENLPDSRSEFRSELRASRVQSRCQDSTPAMRLRWVKFSAKYCTVFLDRCRHRWISTVEKPSLVRQDTWNSSRWGTDVGERICRILSSVHLGLSLLPMLVTLKFRRLLDLDRKCERLVRLIRDSRRFFRLTKGTVLP